jgi:chloramphenicol O-acetyltransferase
MYISMFYFNAISLPLKVTTSYVSENTQVFSIQIIYHLVLRFDHTIILKIRISNRMLPCSYGSVKVKYLVVHHDMKAYNRVET